MPRPGSRLGLGLLTLAALSCAARAVEQELRGEVLVFELVVEAACAPASCRASLEHAGAGDGAPVAEGALLPGPNTLLLRGLQPGRYVMGTVCQAPTPCGVRPARVGLVVQPGNGTDEHGSAAVDTLGVELRLGSRLPARGLSLSASRSLGADAAVLVLLAGSAWVLLRGGKA